MTDAFRLGGVTEKLITPEQAILQRLTMLIWSISGAGKTVLAGTAPGKKLWISFDPDGMLSLELAKRDDIVPLDFSDADVKIVNEFKEGGEIEGQLYTRLVARPDIHTVVVDSVTSFGAMATVYGVTSGKAGKGALVEQPGVAGYGIRNRLVLAMVRVILRATARANRHCIFIAHEDVPAKDKEGVIQSITILLGGSLPQEVALQISEVWNMTDTNKVRTIRVRPQGVYQPMRTRMFRVEGETQFQWKYDQYSTAPSNQEHTIASWYAKWQEAQFSKIALPK